jgi:uncharacterized membrane protein
MTLAPPDTSGFALDQVELACRWIHVAAAALWVGLTWSAAWILRPAGAPDAERERRLDAWTRWGALVTVLAGATLLFLVYYGPRTAYLTGARPEPGQWMLAFLALGAGFAAYDALARLPGRLEALGLGAFLGLALLFAWSLESRLAFAPRGVYVHAGAFLATTMAGNAWRRGLGPAARARRVRHNALLSLPVLLLMVGVGQAGLFAWGVLPTLAAVLAISAMAAALLERLGRIA